MLFKPDFNFKLLTAEKFTENIGRINEELSQYAVTGTFNSHDNKPLFYEYFLCENAKANIVIVHGLSEFTKKFYEFTYYCLNSGYNVFMYDQRGHGLSFRETKDKTLIHVKNYNQYEKDLSKFIQTVVIPISDKQIYLYSHSMGGAVAILNLAQGNSRIKKAVLSAPLIEPYLGYSLPRWLARTGLACAKFFIGGKRRFPGSKDFNPEVKYNGKNEQCEVRFKYNLNMRCQNENYQTTPLSIGWTYATLGLREKLLKKSLVKKINTPILLITAEKDTTVKNDAHYEFANKCCLCEHKVIKDAKHGMLTSTNEIMKEHIELTMRFLES